MLCPPFFQSVRRLRSRGRFVKKEFPPVVCGEVEGPRTVPSPCYFAKRAEPDQRGFLIHEGTSFNKVPGFLKPDDGMPANCSQRCGTSVNG